MIQIGILGASGYTALELIKLLLRHPSVEITCLTSRQESQPHVSEVHPCLAGRLDLRLEPVDIESVSRRCDLVFSCLPHASSANVLQSIRSSDAKVVDLSADYRLWNQAIYEQWYTSPHPDPARLGNVVYGLPELFRDEIRNADFVANPGCYPTSAILALAPLLRHQLIKTDDIIIDSKSGVTGAGRSLKLMTHFPECNESLQAYQVGLHRHGPEIGQLLTHAAEKDVAVIFTPHLIPMDRGILTTAYAKKTDDGVDTDHVLTVLKDFYRAEPFVRVGPELPATKDSAHTNFCDMTARVVENRIITVSCIDNLIKGASGAAVQNMNLMFDWDETTGLM